MSDLNEFLTSYYGSFAIINHMWWVPRTLDGDAGAVFPVPSPNSIGTLTRTQDGWPTATSDPVAPRQPFITDWAMNDGGLESNVTAALYGHCPGNNGRGLISVNRGYVDGRVETVPLVRMQWQNYGNYTAYY